MQTTLTELKNPVWMNEAQTAINCEIKTSQTGDMVLPFTADMNDVEQYGRQIFADIVAGKYGPIQPFAGE